MKLQMTGQLRLEQQMKLAPHMIQSMEILQLPILALQERIEQELVSNPVLEIEESENTELQSQEQSEQTPTASADSVTEKAEDFEKINSLDDDYLDYLRRSQTFHKNASDETDKKLEAMKNTEAAPLSLHEYLSEQFGLVEADEKVKKAGQAIIDYIDDRGCLTVRLEQLLNRDRNDFSLEDLHQALALVHKLEPLGVGARDMSETLLIQMENSSEDYSFEKKLVSEYMDQLLENRLPDIAKKMKCSIEQVNKAIERISHLDTSPGLQVGKSQNTPITADVIVEEADIPEGFMVRLADVAVPTLKISDYYFNLVKDAGTNEKTKKYLQDHIRSARWIIDAIQQRNSTLLKVTKVIVKYQRPFFEKGQLYLKPLPMSKVADDIGVHLATISRSVAAKYVQCFWGILPLRKFFSGGTEDVDGNAHSWQAVRAKLQQIIDSEDKTKPLSDDQIKAGLAEAGLNNIARRTVAKYRKLLNIPAARFRKKF